MLMSSLVATGTCSPCGRRFAPVQTAVSVLTRSSGTTVAGNGARGRRGWCRSRPSSAVAQWAVLDPRSRPSRTPRGLLVLRCVVGGRIDYVLDIERRPTSSREIAESFSGLVFTLHNDADLERWLRRLLGGLPDKSGVVGSLLEECPGRAALFKHSRSGSGLSEAAARNALAKLFGLLFPDGRSSEP